MPSLWFENALLSDGWSTSVRLTHQDGVIGGVEKGARPAPEDERHAIGLPGLTNVHSHGFQRGMAGLAEVSGAGADDFWTWRAVMYRFLDRMTPDDLEAITAFAFMEMLEAGFTRVGEFHYVHHDPAGRPYADIAELSVRVAAAAADSGVALTLIPVFYAQGDFGGAPAGAGQRRFLNSVDAFADLLAGARAAVSGLPGGRLGLAPHSLRAVTPDQLSALLPLSDGGPVHIHAAEQVKEVEACLAWSGRRPVEWLLDHAPVDGRWCLVHATHMTQDEVRRLAATGAVAGLCPVTEANLGDGVFPARDWLAAGGRFGVGSDSNILIDAAGELRALEYSQRLASRARNVLAGAPRASTGARLFAAAIAGGAQALGGAGPGLAPGAPMDVVSLDAGHSALIGREGDFLLDSWIFAAGREAIDCVWRGGMKLVEGGRHRRRGPILAAYRLAMLRLLA